MEDWRKIDIDAVDASSRNKRLTSDAITNNFIQKGVIHSYTASDMSNLIGELSGRVSKNDYAASITEVIVKYPVYAAEDAELKLKYLQLVNSCLVSFKDINSVVGGLSADEADVLLKYCYKIMSIKQFQANGQAIINWVDKIITKFGQGAVLRYITDRKVV